MRFTNWCVISNRSPFGLIGMCDCALTQIQLIRLFVSFVQLDCRFDYAQFSVARANIFVKLREVCFVCLRWWYRLIVSVSTKRNVYLRWRRQQKLVSTIVWFSTRNRSVPDKEMNGEEVHKKKIYLKYFLRRFALNEQSQREVSMERWWRWASVARATLRTNWANTKNEETFKLSLNSISSYDYDSTALSTCIRNLNVTTISHWLAHIRYRNAISNARTKVCFGLASIFRLFKSMFDSALRLCEWKDSNRCGTELK